MRERVRSRREPSKTLGKKRPEKEARHPPLRAPKGQGQIARMLARAVEIQVGENIRAKEELNSIALKLEASNLTPEGHDRLLWRHGEIVRENILGRVRRRTKFMLDSCGIKDPKLREAANKLGEAVVEARLRRDKRKLMQIDFEELPRLFGEKADDLRRAIRMFETGVQMKELDAGLFGPEGPKEKRGH